MTTPIIPSRQSAFSSPVQTPLLSPVTPTTAPTSRAPSASDVDLRAARPAGGVTLRAPPSLLEQLTGFVFSAWRAKPKNSVASTNFAACFTPIAPADQLVRKPRVSAQSIHTERLVRPRIGEQAIRDWHLCGMHFTTQETAEILHDCRTPTNMKAAFLCFSAWADHQGFVRNPDRRPSLRAAESIVAQAFFDAAQCNKHMVSAENFGAYLCDIAKTMDQRNCQVTEAKILVGTRKHMMSMRLHSVVSDHPETLGESHFRLTVYNPEYPAAEMELEVHHPSELRQFGLGDLMMGSLEQYALGPGSVEVCAACLNVDLQQSQTHYSNRATRGLLDGQALASAMGSNASACLQQFAQALAAQPQAMSKDQLYEVLSYTGYVEGSSMQTAPGLGEAMTRGAVGAIEAFGDLLKLADLPRAQMLDVLSARWMPMYYPSLPMIISTQPPEETFVAYGSLLAKMGVTPDEAKHLLEAPGPDGNAMEIARKMGNEGILRGLRQAYLDNGLASNP